MAKKEFNREINNTRIKREKILLPINETGTPDYDYMKQVEYRLIKQYLDRKMQ